jgi:hypothetical protein
MAELRKAKKRTVDFKNVKDRGPFNPAHITGDHLAKISAVYDTESKAGDDMWVFAFELTDHRTAVFPYYCTFADNQLWKLRGVFEAAGVPVPKSRYALDPSKVLGKTIGLTLIEDEYEGKMKGVVDNVWNPKEHAGEDDEVVDDEPLDDDDEDDEPPAKPVRRRKKAPEPEPEEDDEEDEEEEEPEPPKRRRRKPAPKPEPEEDDDEEEDEEPAPPKRRRTAATRAAGRAVKGSTRTRKAKPAEDDEEDLDELDIDDDDL